MTAADEWRDDDAVGLTPLGWAVSDVPWGDDEPPGSVGDDGADDQAEEEEHRGRDDED